MASSGLSIRCRIRAIVATVAIPLFITFPFLLDLPGPLAIGLGATAVWFLVVAMAIARRRTMQNVLVSLASLSFCLACAEIGLGYLNARVELSDNTIEIGDPDLGFRLQPDQRAHARERFDGKVVFDVTYSIDIKGYRVMPAMPVTSVCRVVFFCDSFIFGWGLPDVETLPHHFVVASKGHYRGYNLSVNGYGPHQMLRALQTGQVDRVVDEGPIHLVIYLGLYKHIARVAGRTSWDLRGPRYAIAKDGDGVIYVGPFHGNASAALLHFFLENSEIFSLLHRFFLSVDLPRVEDVPLFVAIVKETKREVERRYGPGTFIVLLWQSHDEEQGFGIDLSSQLAEAGVEAIKITQALTDFDRNREAYLLSPADPHPNAAATRQIGAFLARELEPQHCRQSGARW